MDLAHLIRGSYLYETWGSVMDAEIRRGHVHF